MDIPEKSWNQIEEYIWRWYLILQNSPGFCFRTISQVSTRSYCIIIIRSDYKIEFMNEKTHTKKRKWKVVQSKYLFKSQFVTLRADTVELPSGEKVDDYTILEVPDGVVVIALKADGNVLFTRQYRHGTSETLLQLPGGSYDKKSEDPKQAARRELLEETGYQATDLAYLGEISIYPSKMTKKVSIYLAKDVEQKSTTQFDNTEDIQTVSFPLTEVVTLIETGKIIDGEAIAGIFFALQHLK